jgi:hypothetical protein
MFKKTFLMKNKKKNTHEKCGLQLNLSLAEYKHLRTW